jgi:hypothetical protein
MTPEAVGYSRVGRAGEVGMSFDAVREALGPQRIRNAFLLSRTDGYCYVANPKAACSTLKLYLCRCELRDPAYKPASVHRRKCLPHPHPMKLAPDAREALVNGEVFVFSFVRHPIARALSAYVDKIRGNARQKDAILRALGRDPADRSQAVSFDAFVGVIAEHPPASLNPHWRPQVHNLLPGLVPYAFIGRVERFGADLEALQARLGLPAYPMTARNRKSGRVDPEALMTPALESKLTRLYERDFEALGYTPEAWRGRLAG